ncbi:MAG: hypothetical protein ACOC3J_05235 [Gemmatimonadota bacterium]
MPFDLAEIRDRKVVQWGLAYLGGAWLLLQLMDVLETPLGISRPVFLAITLLILLGVPVTVVLAWYHGEQGRQRVSGPELMIIGGILGIAGTIRRRPSPRCRRRKPPRTGFLSPCCRSRT